MDEENPVNSDLQGKGSLEGQLATPETHSQDGTQEAVHSFQPRDNGDQGQRPTLLSTALSELASRYDTGSMIKVDTMLTQPCQYLEGVSVFSMNEGASTSKESESGKVSNQENMQGISAMCGDTDGRDGEQQEDAREQNGSSSKDEGQDKKIDLLDAAPFLMSEDGVVFQCFPVFEKEVFIVSLEDEALLMNDALPENIPVTPEIVLEESNELELTESCRNATLNQVKLDVQEKSNQSQSLKRTEKSREEKSLTTNTKDNQSSDKRDDNGDGINPSGGLCAPKGVEIEKVMSLPLLSEMSEPPEESYDNSPEKLKKKKINVSTPPNKPPVHKAKTSAAEVEEPLLSEWFRCYVCSVVLPSAASLRHHLVKQHDEKTIESHQCFLCEHECWSESQLEWHLRVQHGVKNKALACPVCGYQLSTTAECRAHVRKHPLTLTCPSCPLKFAAHHQLVAHAREHLAQMHPHKCLVCGHRFTCNSALQLHSWRHLLQKCPQDGCDYLAEDESWLMLHLQRQHALGTDDVREILTERDASDQKMDTLLEKYLSVQTLQQTEPSSEQEDSKVSMSADDHTACFPLNFVTEEEKIAEKDFDVVKNVMDNVIETVIGVEEEEGKKLRNEEDALQKVIDKGPSLYRCGLCNMYLSSAEELTTHKAGHSQVIECDKCQKKFQSVKQLKRHLITHKSQDHADTAGTNANKVPPQFPCLECGKICRSESALSRHKGTHSRNQGHQQCQICKRRVRTRAHLTEHMARVHKIHHESKKLQCPICDRRFTSKVHLDSHLTSHGEADPLWSCDKCGRNYIRHRSLLRHMATHDQSYVCQTCNETFVSAQRLAVHVRSHDPNHKTRHACPRCPQKYAYESQLQVHMRIHTGEKPYVCEICGKCFKRLQQCKAHHRMIHSNNKESCIECGKMFGDKGNLLRHRLMVHYHLKRWVCGACGQSYAYSQDLWTHLQKTHSLPFERLDSSNRKSLHEVYVIPEIGTHKLNPEVQATVEAVCREERQKVRQVLSGALPNMLRKSQKLSAENAESSDDPDNPKPIGETPMTIRPVVVPSSNLGLPIVDGTGQVQTLDRTAQNVMTVIDENQGLVQVRVLNVKCIECGGEAPTPLQCGVCGATACAQPHMDMHVASAHRVVFQCSVCGLHYSSQGDCVAHVTTAHSSHLLAVQGGSTTYLPQQPMQPLQVPSAAPPPQLCVPLAPPQSGPQCLVQVANGAPQMPVVIAPTGIATQQVAPTNVILQYPSVNSSMPSNVPIVLQTPAPLGPNGSQGKQATIVPTHVPIASKQRLKKSEHELKQEKALCTITLPTNQTSGVLNESNSVGGHPNGQTTTSLQTLIPQPGSGENTLLLDSTLAPQEGNTAPVLLVGSVPFADAPASTCTDLSQPKPGTVSNPVNTSVASVLLTLAEAPQHDATSSGLIITGNTSNAALGDASSHTPLMTVGDSQLTHSGTGTQDVDNGSQLVQSLISLPVQGMDQGGQEQSTSNQVSQTVDEESSGPPQEVSVEIIQTRPRKEKTTKSSLRKKSQEKRQNGEPDAFGLSGPYTCGICHKNFTSTARLEKHQVKHSQSFQCQVCSKSFTEKYNLKTHMLTHTQDRPHVCNLCSKSFRYMRDLTEHKHTHEGVRPHVCETCNKGFVRQRELARHVREQHGTQRHLCKICGAAFKRRMYLETVHMRSHHPEAVQDSGEEKQPKTAEKKQNHICRICGRNFAQARYLTSHLRTHSKRAEYVKCPRCPRMFTSELTLKVHKETFHRETTADQDQVIEEGETEDENTPVVSGFQPHSDQKAGPEISQGSEINHVAHADQIFSSTHMQHSHILHPASLDPAEQGTYCSASVRPGDTLESDGRAEAMVQFNVHMDDCDPITYLAPSFSTE